MATMNQEQNCIRKKHSDFFFKVFEIKNMRAEEEISMDSFRDKIEKSSQNLSKKTKMENKNKKLTE